MAGHILSMFDVSCAGLCGKATADIHRVATTLRKPHLLRWNPYTEESLAILSTSKDALPTDVWLCHMVRAEHIVEDVHFQFSMDDPMTSISPTDRSTEIYIKLFEKRIQDWRVAATPDMPQGK